MEATGVAGKTIPEMENSMAVNGTIIYLGRTGKAASLLWTVLLQEQIRLLAPEVIVDMVSIQILYNYL